MEGLETVLVVSRRNTVYTRKGVPTEVVLDDMVSKFIEAGMLEVVEPNVRTGVTSNGDPGVGPVPSQPISSLETRQRVAEPFGAETETSEPKKTVASPKAATETDTPTKKKLDEDSGSS